MTTRVLGQGFFSCFTISNVGFSRVALVFCCTFFLLYFLHIVLFPYCTFSVWYSFYFLFVISFTFLYFPTEIFEFSFNPRCKIGWPQGHLDRVFSCFAISNVRFSRVALVSCCTFLVLHFLHIVLFPCCAFYVWYSICFCYFFSLFMVFFRAVF